jgi:hypothetical protein
MKRHIGRIVNTDQRCVVVFMQIPGKSDHALVVSTDNLPPRFEQALMNVVESDEGQGQANLGDILGRRLMPDDGRTLLQALHESGLLRPTHVDQVVMLPVPNMPFPLRRVLESMGMEIVASEPPAYPFAEPAQEKYNPHQTNQRNDRANEALTLANNLLTEAAMLETEAKRKREKAYAAAPSLRPAVIETAPTAAPTAPSLSQADLERLADIMEGKRSAAELAAASAPADAPVITPGELEALADLMEAGSETQVEIAPEQVVETTEKRAARAKKTASN